MIRIDNNSSSNTCPVCGSAGIRTVGEMAYHGKEIRFASNRIFLEKIPVLALCSSCQSRFTNNRIPDTTLAELYDCKEDQEQRWSYQNFTDDKTQATVAFIHEAIEKAKPGSILDFGCGTGDFLNHVKNIYPAITTYGFDLNRSVKPLLEKKGHVFLDSLEGRSFDLVAAFDVIEHVTDVDMFFRQLHKVISPRGYLVILTGDPQSALAKLDRSKWYYANYPEHIVFPSLLYMKRRNDFSYVRHMNVFANRHREATMNGISGIYRKIIFHYMGRSAADHNLILLQKK
jgi:ubiquinone/menaquinone biosynthesis C-methylase UbiE